ncbi:hypothetical protein KIW84_055364 [Lathyrus oleraceus]|uniref:DNA ligase ATP-dependent N-terminal domain-containing protein n=1 Tax=Pisum sativum TaxID=3888 RepID=A0A9D4WXT7_PEA|nr:hypothetical protein KIW84_055364 [Pisum sativum]
MKERVPQLKKKPSSFAPSEVACWKKDKPVPFLLLSLAFDMIDAESGRIVMTDIVYNLLRTVIHVAPEDLVSVVYLSANRIAPAHAGLELGIGDASIIKALAEAYGRTEKQIENQYKEKHISSYCKGIWKRQNHIKSLPVAAIDCEPLYIIRLLQSKLRIGYAEQTPLAALGHVAVYTEKNFQPTNLQSKENRTCNQQNLQIQNPNSIFKNPNKLTPPNHNKFHFASSSNSKTRTLTSEPIEPSSNPLYTL